MNDPVRTLEDLCETTKVELITSSSPDQSLIVERLRPFCYKYEQLLVDIIAALKASDGEVALPSQPLGLQPTTLRLNLREARNGFKSGVKSDKLPPDFDLDRLEFSLSTNCRGVTIRDSERRRMANVAIPKSSKFKSDYDFGVVGFFVYSEEVANVIVALQKLCGGTASIFGAAKFKVASDAELQQLKAIFKETAVGIRIRDGFVEVAV